MKKGEQYLMKRDRRILGFVYRYRIATDDMLAQVYFARRTSNANVARVIRKLVRRGLLRKVPYGDRQFYLVLTRRGCRAIGVPDWTPRPLTEQSLPVVLAIAWYCVRRGVARVTSREFRDLYPQLWRPHLRSSSYYLADTPEGRKLGMFLVDRGGTARRIRGKIRRIVRQRMDLPCFVSLIHAGRFRVTVLTGLPAQQRLVRRYLKGDTFHGVEVETALAPEVAELLTLK